MLLATGSTLPEGPQRIAVLEKVQALAPGTRLAAKAKKLQGKGDKAGVKQGIHVDWDVYLMERSTGSIMM
jgi:hypothetical protein